MKNKIVKIAINGNERLYVVISPNEMNEFLPTVIVCPLVSGKRLYPTQVLIKGSEKSGLMCDCHVTLNQINSIEKSFIINEVGEISEKETEQIALVLLEMFAL